MRRYLAIVSVATLISSAAHADKVDWSVCQPEIGKWCQGVKEKGGEEAIYQCLLKHDADLSKKCDNDAHSPYEKLTGKLQR